MKFRNVIKYGFYNFHSAKEEYLRNIYKYIISLYDGYRIYVLSFVYFYIYNIFI